MAVMKVARLYDSSDIRFEDEPIPQVGPGEALVKTRACGICSGDVMGWYMKKKAPLVFGHEPAGEIVAVGSGVTDVRPGDRVFVHHHAPCFTCRACQRGEFVQCATWRSSRIVPGGMAEYFLVPKENLAGDTLRLPDDLSFADGSLVEPAACVVKSLRKSGLQGGESVFIIGLGIMGQLHVALARQANAGQIIGTDFVAYRRERAQQLGADISFDPAQGDVVEQLRAYTKGAMAEVVIVGPGSVEAMELGLKCVAKGGTVVLFTTSTPEARLAVSPYDLYFNEIRLIPSYSCGPNDTREALQLIRDGVVTADKFITHRYPFAALHDAYRTASEARDSIKTIIEFA
ncbi:MAG: alcohol dehydrogenase catalytic domain-containing protein [Deltaproteobacteria bacterium]|nr:alcohol dehydrogenase catalytic domain-containing protein [Deltaproteobacteria bacterium]